MASHSRAYTAAAGSVLWCLAVASVAWGQVTVEAADYHGWRGALEIANGDARLVVVPEIGRIMYYGFAGPDEEDVLWNDAAQFGRILPVGEPVRQDGQIVWANFGGDKVWPNQQDEFEAINGYGWPPDPWFDGSPQVAERLDDGVRITSPVSRFNGARVIRDIRLATTGARVTIRQRLEKVHPAARVELEPLRYTIWSVTQIRPPEQVLYPLNPHSALPGGYRTWEGMAVDGNLRKEGYIAIVSPSLEGGKKSGADADRWLAAIVGQTVIAQFFRRDSTQEYPDGGVSAEVYTSPDYTELELLSPWTVLAVGQALEFTIAWDLHQLPAASRTPEARRQAALAWLWAQPSPVTEPQAR